MIYLDNAATTRVFDSAIAAACEKMHDGYFNPNATYKSGVAARESLESSRRVIASAVGALPSELVFTSGATESNNWVFNCGIKYKKGNIVISAGEHSSVYEVAMQFKSRGTDVRIVPLNGDGTIDAKALLELTDENTALVSFIHVSNETGVVNPVKELVKSIRVKAPRAAVHCDGVQALMKIHEPIDGLGVDYYSASAHKLGAPKGIGLLYIRDGLNIAPQLYGGGQERGLRSGTQNTPFIAAFAAAVQEFKKQESLEKTRYIHSELTNIFSSHGCKIIGSGAKNSGYILCVCVPDVKAEILQNAVYEHGIVIGKGAACSGSKRGNRVLSAMGLPADKIESCIRISLFVDTEYDDAVKAAEVILDTAQKIRR